MGTFRIGQRGFTLAEIVVAVGIVAVLATVAIGSFSEMRKKAHDTQRKSDIEQIQLALRMYKNTNGAYPDCDTGMVIGVNAAKPSGCTDDIDDKLTPYFPSVPKDPISDTEYQYVYDSDFNCPTVGNNKKVLYAKNTETNTITNWTSSCNGVSPGGPSSKPYVIILQ